MVHKDLDSFARVDFFEQYRVEKSVIRIRITIVFYFLRYLRGIEENMIHALICIYMNIAKLE